MEEGALKMEDDGSAPDLPSVLHVLTGVAAGLAYLHRCGIVHGGACVCSRSAMLMLAEQWRQRGGGLGGECLGGLLSGAARKPEHGV
jgi:hypothetical protein